MEIRKGKMSESLVNYAEEIAEDYIQLNHLKDRKSKGQFFTPKRVSLFMADLFDISKQNIKLLDPGAGVGMLSAAFCNRILESNRMVSLSINAYENDPALLPFLEKALKRCKTELEKKGHEVKYKIFEEDFILHNAEYLKKDALFDTKNGLAFFDYIISNPPYYKLNKSSPQSKLMNEFVLGQPNIYAFFMALSLKMLNLNGQMVFITPRSFCSGLYFKRFRKWFLHNGAINNIHTFESRSNVFNRDGVLQENIIVKVTANENAKTRKRVVITTSKDKLFHGFHKMNVNYEDILHRRNGDIFIKIPSKKIDIRAHHTINSWKYTLRDLGLKVSTGPIVPFRAKKHLSREFRDKKTTVPLLWMHNIQGMDVVWPLEKKKREEAVKLEEKTKPLLVPVSNYVLVKRFSSKEQKRRLYAGVLLKSKFNFEKIGIENHLNYIYRCNGMLSTEEAYGIAGILDTSMVDGFFRMMNGNTQVNATDIMNLPLPAIENIRKIGKLIKKKPLIGLELDETVSDILGIEKELVEIEQREY